MLDQTWKSGETVLQQMESFGYLHICSADPAYPRNLIKHDSPDWIYKGFGLEVTQAISEEMLDIFYKIPPKPFSMENVLNKEFRYGCKIEFAFKNSSGEVITCYYYPMTRIITHDSKAWQIDKIEPHLLHKIKKCPIILLSPMSPFLNPYETLDKISHAFTEKINKLQGYDSEICDLCIYCGSFIRDSGRDLKTLLNKFQDKSNDEKIFRRVYLILVNYMLTFDTIKNQVSYSPINSDTIMNLIMDLKIKKGQTIPKKVMDSVPTDNIPYIVDLESEYPPSVQKWLEKRQ